MLKQKSEDNKNKQELRILVFPLEIHHPVCLHHHCTLIVWQMKMMGAEAVISTNMILTMWPSVIKMKIQIYLGLAPWWTLEKRPTRMGLVEVAVETSIKVKEEHMLSCMR